MKAYFENDGEANEQGEFVAVVDMENGKPPNRFKGKTHKEVSDKLLQAQGLASARIEELRGEQKPTIAKPVTVIGGKTFSADDRFKLTRELGDPATALEAVSQIVEAQVGVPLAQLRENLNKEQADKMVADVTNASVRFTQLHPEYFICKHNSQTMAGYMRSQNWDPAVVENYELAFEKLTASKLLVEKPEQSEEAAAELPAGTSQPAAPPQAGELPPGTTRRPRGVISQTGVLPGDASGSSEQRRPAAPKYTREQIQLMPEAEYKAKLQSEPGFADLVDKLFTQTTAAAR
jgi:hypothetical protein